MCYNCIESYHNSLVNGIWMQKNWSGHKTYPDHFGAMEGSSNEVDRTAVRSTSQTAAGLRKNRLSCGLPQGFSPSQHKKDVLQNENFTTRHTRNFVSRVNSVGICCNIWWFWLCKSQNGGHAWAAKSNLTDLLQFCNSSFAKDWPKVV